MNAPAYFELLRLSAPELVLTLTALAVLMVDLTVMAAVERSHRRLVAVAITAVGCTAAVFVTLLAEGAAAAPGGMLAADPLTRLVKVGLLVLAALAAAVSVEADFTQHVGEFFALLLLATLGMLFLVSAENLLMVFVALELTSLSLYVLAAFNQRNPRSAEAALKYFLFGGTAAAFLLFGFSLVYGATGALELRDIARALGPRALDPLLAVALVMIVMGLGFKVAAVPFHLWAPETYQGAPTPSAAYIASSSKVASFVVLAKVLMLGFPAVAGSGAWHGYVAGWVPLLAVLAAFSVVLGNLAALAQTSVKRLLAYSAVAHAGYTLVGVAADTLPGLQAVVYYTLTYAVAAMGAFAVVALVEDAQGEATLGAFAGLSRRAPVMALCLMVFLLSLAGIPPLAGFFGKFFLFAAAIQAGPGDLGLLWLVILAVAMSTVSLYYYLQVLKQAYVAEDQTLAPLRPSGVFQLAVVVLALLVVVLGCAPDLLVSPLASAVTAAGL